MLSTSDEADTIMQSRNEWCKNALNGVKVRSMLQWISLLCFCCGCCVCRDSNVICWTKNEMTAMEKYTSVKFNLIVMVTDLLEQIVLLSLCVANNLPTLNTTT